MLSSKERALQYTTDMKELESQHVVEWKDKVDDLVEILNERERDMKVSINSKVLTPYKYTLFCKYFYDHIVIIDESLVIVVKSLNHKLNKHVFLREISVKKIVKS